MEENFDFKQLFRSILSNFYVVILFSILGCFVGWIYNNTKTVQTYYYASLKIELPIDYTVSDSMDVTAQLIDNYIQFIRGEEIIEGTINDLNISLSYSEVIDRLNVTYFDKLKVINIRYRDYEEEIAKKFVVQLYKKFISAENMFKNEDIIFNKEPVIEKIVISERNQRYVISGLLLGLIYGLTFAYGLTLLKINERRFDINE